MTSSYVIALGSNRRGRHGAPGDEVRAALAAIGGIVMTSKLITTAPLGPARRRFVNAAALIETEDDPIELLARLKAIEAAFGRRRGQRWTDRVIDLDIVLWSGGAWASDGLTVPHPDFRRRDFVLRPLTAIVPDWRDPLTGRTVRQLAARRRRD
jgi:2-amino-4-hydroxy-6-hydroxymethyldihydropteridine diphosphokinase